MKKSLKLTLIIVGIVLSVIILNICMFASVNNKLINYEEQINESSSGINIQEKRRADLLYNLVDTAKAYSKYEQETLSKITDARSKIESGDLEEAKTLLNAVVENYPEIKANEQYKQIMYEMSTTENMIANYRENYNEQVKNYNKYLRKFPVNIISGILGYKKVDADYLKYEASESAPTNLWD